LGEALSTSPDITLFHEYDSRAFFEAVDAFFMETARHQQHPDFVNYAQAMPVRERDAAKIAQSVFATVTGKATRIIGTKFPGHQSWPAPAMPPGIRAKEIMVTRNPYDVVYSYAHKMVGDGQAADLPSAAKVAFNHWIDAWSYTVRNRDNPDFLNVFYDELNGNNAEVASVVSQFLQLSEAPDLSSLSARQDPDIRTKFELADLSEVFNELNQMWSYEEWLDRAKADLTQGAVAILPLPAAGLDMSDQRQASLFTSGFYPSEPDGAWTKGGESSITFRPSLDAEAKDYFLVLHIVWAAMRGDQAPQVIIEVDGNQIADLALHLGWKNGSGADYHFKVPNYMPRSNGTTVKISVKEPLNPKRLGVSEDDRDLGLMIKRVAFHPIASSDPRIVHGSAEVSDQLSIVCQGPLPSPADQVRVFREMRFAKAMGFRTILSTWENEVISDDARNSFDTIVVSADPGTTRYNAYRQSISSLAGLALCSGPTLKTRTDIVLTGQFLAAIASDAERRGILVTNVFTRIHPYHLSDMVAFSSADILRDFYAIENRTEAKDCEERFTLTLLSRRFPSVYDAYFEPNKGEAWRHFIDKEVTVWDFKAAGLEWLRCRRIEDHQDWKFAPDKSPGTEGVGELMMGETPFPTAMPADELPPLEPRGRFSVGSIVKAGKLALRSVRRPQSSTQASR
jgi:hypothetical protein